MAPEDNIPTPAFLLESLLKKSRTIWQLFIGTIFLLAVTPFAATGPAVAGAKGHGGHGHYKHTAKTNDAGYTRSVTRFELPDVSLRNQQAQPTTLTAALAHDGPVLAQFIFTSCATICPVMSATFSQAQKGLTTVQADYKLVSISIDPEYDTPERLRDFGKQYGAGENWIFLTGPEKQIRKVMRTFNVVYQGDNKMYHQPYTFMRAKPDAPWIRLDGLVSAAALVEEYRAMLIGDRTEIKR